MKRIVLSTLTLFACGLQAQPATTVGPMEKSVMLATFTKPIEAADLATFEKLFNAHEITPEEKKTLTMFARVARTKIKTEVDAMGNHNGNAPTFLKGLGQGVVGLWSLVNLGLACLAISHTPGSAKTEEDTWPFPKAFLLPVTRSIFCCTQATKTYDTDEEMLTLRFEPSLDQQVPRFCAGCVLTGVPFAALTAYAFYKAGVNISRGLNYKKYLETKIANLDVMIEYLA